MGHRRGLSKGSLETVAGHTVDQAYLDILNLGANSLWLPCSTMLVLTGELILGARSGKILSNAIDEWTAKVDQEAWYDVHAVNNLRNVFCHPGDPPVDAMLSHMARDRNERELATQISSNWALLRQRSVSEYALRKLDAVGHHVMRRWNI